MKRYTSKEFIDQLENSISLMRWQTTYLPILNEIKKIRDYRKEKVLDFGCGAAVPNRIMREVYGLNIHGVDISLDMINAALKNDPEGRYIKVNSRGKLPFDKNSYMACYSSFVFVEMSSLTDIKHWLCEIHRTLKDGALIVLTINNLSLVGKADFKYSQIVKFGIEGKNYKTGEPFEIKLRGIPEKNIPDISFVDYYWPFKIFKEIMLETGFKNIKYKVHRNTNSIKNEVKNLISNGIKIIDTREIEGTSGILTAEK